MFDEKYRLYEDWPMWLKFSGSDANFMFWGEVPIKYRSGEPSFSNYEK